MITERDFRLAARLSTVAVLIVLLASTAAAEWHEKVLYSFQGDALTVHIPAGGVVFDKLGNLYGATQRGRRDELLSHGIAQCGTVYQLSAACEAGRSLGLRLSCCMYSKANSTTTAKFLRAA